MENTRGSEWRKWDLHVHTPESIVQHYKKKDNDDIWESYIKDIEKLPSEIKVLGINDYIFLDGYKKVKEYKDKGRLSNIDLLLPVIELRLAKFCGHKQFKRINYHIIFSNEIDASVIEQQFLNALTAQYKLDSDSKQTTWGGVITKDNLISLGKNIKESVPKEKLQDYGNDLEEGFNNLNIEVSCIETALRNASNFFEGKYITAIGKTEWDSLNWNDSSIGEKKNIINGADIVFTASESIDSFVKSKKKLEEQHVNCFLIDCSDSHSNSWSNDKDRLGNCFTWLKADPTFEGLKQILYEPEERVKIQEERPDDKKGYQVIDSVTIHEDGFWDDTIYLNDNLNTIIGGRSTGKSTLLKSIAKKIDATTKLEENEHNFINNHLTGVSIKWKDSLDNTSRYIQYLPQDYMHTIAKNEKRELDNLIEKIIGNKDGYESLRTYNDDNKKLEKILNKNILDVFQLQKELTELQAQLKEKGDKQGVENEIERLNKKIKELSGTTGLLPEEIEQYQRSSTKIGKFQYSIEQANNDISQLGSLKEHNIFDDDFACCLGNLSDALKNNVSISFEQLKVQVTQQWSEQLDAFIENLNEEIKQNSSMKNELENSDIIRKGREYYNNNKELADIQSKLKEEEKRLQEIKEIEKKVSNAKERMSVMITTIVNDHCKYKENATALQANLKISHEGVEISTKIKCQSDDFNEFLKQRCYLRGDARQKYVDEIIENYENNTHKVCEKFVKDTLQGNIDFKNYNTPQNVLVEFLTKNWYEYSFELTYQQDNFNEMSPGKKAFVILKLLLEFDTRECPILIDQPEDSLDNRAIYKDLVEYIKEKKKTRQIILVTHNSNVVVSADSENVIVANQHSKNSKNRDNIRFQYVNGSLESTKQKDTANQIILDSQGIREHVCEILEGGQEAFEKREKKYGL